MKLLTEKARSPLHFKQPCGNENRRSGSQQAHAWAFINNEWPLLAVVKMAGLFLSIVVLPMVSKLNSYVVSHQREKEGVLERERQSVCRSTCLKAAWSACTAIRLKWTLVWPVCQLEPSFSSSLLSSVQRDCTSCSNTTSTGWLTSHSLA